MMKHHILLYATLLFNSILIQADPLLVVVLMVKNEASVMEMTLQPLVDAGIKDFLIYDTGSTDDTVQIIQSFFIKNNISNFVIEQGDWVDFSTSRNRALELTEEHFPDAVFMLMLDAEWILHKGVDLLGYCKQHKNDSTTLYVISVKGSNLEFYHPRLIRSRSNIFFMGKVHETPNAIPQAKIPHHIYIELSKTHYGQEKSKSRWLRDRDLLLEDLQHNPNNSRTVFFLAQTYFCLGDIANAIKWYEQRSTMHGYDEEDFVAVAALAQAYQIAGNTEQMIACYLKAFSMRPHRAEPLIRLAEYYYSIQAYHLCYLLTKACVTMPYPHNDVCFVEFWLYHFVRYNLLSATACIVGDYALGKQATIKALEVCPYEQYLQDNLKFYQQMLP